MYIDDIDLAVAVDVYPVIYALRQKIKVVLVDEPVFGVIEFTQNAPARYVQFFDIYGQKVRADPVRIGIDQALHNGDVLFVPPAVLVYIYGIFQRT